MKAAKMHGQALFDSPTPLSFLGRKFRLSGVITIDRISLRTYRMIFLLALSACVKPNRKPSGQNLKDK
jgi:hypothetical protein